MTRLSLVTTAALFALSSSLAFAQAPAATTTAPKPPALISWRAGIVSASRGPCLALGSIPYTLRPSQWGESSHKCTASERCAAVSVAL